MFRHVLSGFFPDAAYVMAASPPPSSTVNKFANAAQPNLNLTPEEKRVYGQLFRQADTDGVGIVTGETAVKFFEKTRLDSGILGEVGSPKRPVPHLSLCSC